MHGVERPMTKRAALPSYLTAALALLALLTLPAAARGQWAQDASNNIHNTNTGNVGVGTGASAPAGKLEVRQIGNTGLYATLLLSFGANEDTFIRGGSSAAVIHIGDLTATTSKLLLMENGGIVGIGTTSPGILNGLDFSGYIHLHIKSTTTTSRFLAIDSAASNSGIVLNDSSQAADNRIWTMSQAAGNGKLTFSTYTDVGTPTHRLVIDRSGNVGIGTAIPTRKLDLAGDVGGLSFEAGSGSPNSGVIRFGDSSGWKLHFGRSRDSIGGALNAGTSGVLMTIQDNGNVGVGNVAPGYRLDVQGGQVNASGGLCIAGDCRAAWSQVATNPSQWTTTSGSDIYYNTGNVGLGTSPSAARLHLYSPGNTYLRIGAPLAYQSSIAFNDDTYGQDIVLYRPDGTRNFSVWTASAGQTLNVMQAGNVGIGTSTPSTSYKLDVAGRVNGTGLCIAGDCKTAWSQVGGGSASNVAAVNVSAGQFGASVGGGNFSFPASVGVGTPNPAGRFEVAGGSIFLGDMGNAGWGNMVVRGRVFSANNNIHLSPPGGSTVFINSDYREAGGATGLVNLNVSGNITGGTINATYQDVAEWVPSTQRLSAGTVVVLDVAHSNHVLASTTSYDTAVAGVVSERPGISLGESGEGKVLVATTGRVKVRADATRAPIHVGDLLVTSDTEGLAMRSEPVVVGGRKMHAPGTIIGKALEPLESGRAEILVLLSLQ